MWPGLKKRCATSGRSTWRLRQEIESATAITDEEVLEKVSAAAEAAFADKLEKIGEENFTQFERVVLLQSIDSHWREHLSALDYLRQGIHLRGYAQKQPKQEYKREAFELFGQLLDSVKNEVTKMLMTVQVQSGEQLDQAAEALESRAENITNVTYTAPTETGEVETTVDEASQRRQQAGCRFSPAARGPQRPVPLRLGQKIQALPRQADLSRNAAGLFQGRHGRPNPFFLESSPCL